MVVYKVRKGNTEFYIQPDMIKSYQEDGYLVYRLTETLVEDEASVGYTGECL